MPPLKIRGGWGSYENLVNIWILQHDIAFSFELKAKLKTIFENEKPWFDKLTSANGALRGRLHPALPVEGATQAPRIEVFHTVQSFWEEYEKLPKNRHKKPDFLILDIMLPDGNGVDLYLDLKKRNEAASVLFCSSTNYTQFEEFFEKRGGETPAFILKSQVEGGLEKQVRSFFPLKESSKRTEVSFFQKRDFDQLDQILKEIEKEFYQSPSSFKKETFELLHKLFLKLGFQKEAGLVEKILFLFSNKNSLKWKTLVKELLRHGQART